MSKKSTGQSRVNEQKTKELLLHLSDGRPHIPEASQDEGLEGIKVGRSGKLQP